MRLQISKPAFAIVILAVLALSAITVFADFQTRVKADFDLGTYENTSYNTTGSYASLNANLFAGTYTSPTFTAGGFLKGSWVNITWTEGAPYGENLPDGGTTEASTVLSGANMTGNILLYHLDEGSGQIAVDSSGNNNNSSTSKAFSGTASRLLRAFSLNGTGDHIRINGSFSPNLTSNGFAIELWVNTAALNKSSQALVSKWEAGSGNFTHNVSAAANLPSWQAMNLTALNDSSRGYTGAAFDGRYVYFVPASSNNNIMRYDTTKNFTNNLSTDPSWQIRDVRTLNSLFVSPYFGATFDGRYVYFVQYSNARAKMLRYDTTGNFTNNVTDTLDGNPSWQVMDLRTLNTNFKPYAGAAFDGKYVYFVPGGGSANGAIMRYDTTGNYTANVSNSWQVMDATTLNSSFSDYSGAAFDGRYMYFVHYAAGSMLRYDTTGNFTHNVSNSWQAMDMANLNSSFVAYIGAAIDGRYVYFVPNGNGDIVRYDTTGNFTNNATDTASGTPSWQVTDVTNLNSSLGAFEGAVFDGRYVYFSQNSASIAARYDTTGNFTHNRTTTANGLPSWQMMDANNLNSVFPGLEGTVFDGRYVYFVPITTVREGTVLRYDSAAQNSSFALLFNAEEQAGGLAGAPFGVTIKVANNTSVHSLSANSYLSAGWHHIAATYDGNNLTLYIDGANKSSKGAPNILIQNSTADLIIGAMGSIGTNNTSSSFFNGTIDEVAIFNRSLSANEILNHYKRGAMFLNLTVRISDSGEGWSSFSSAFTNSSFGNLSNISTSQFIQYRATFESLTPNWSIELYNVTLNYTPVPIPKPQSGETGAGGFGGAAGSINTTNQTLRIERAIPRAEVTILLPIKTPVGEIIFKNYTAVLIATSGETATIEFFPTRRVVTLNPQHTTFVDLNGDGINDLQVTLNKIEKGLADITYELLPTAALQGALTARKEIKQNESSSPEKSSSAASFLGQHFVVISLSISIFLAVLILTAIVFRKRIFKKD